MSKYKNATTFRAALEDRIKNHSKKTGKDIPRLRRDVAFDRLLIRLFKMSSPPWALKGGYAMQLRMESARTTKDVDLALKEAALFSDDSEKRNKMIKDILVKQGAIDLGDFFEFKMSDPVKELDGAPDGGVRFHIEAKLDDRTFEKFLLDIGAGDVWSNPLDQLESSSMLEFAGFETVLFPVIPKEQQFAEKLHAYTLPRPKDRMNTRAKDLIDMNLLIADGLEIAKLGSALKETFERRDTHPLSLKLEPPPRIWVAPYKDLAEECELDLDVDVGFAALTHFLKKL